MLILFDIDGTLLTGDGVGMRALEKASQSLFDKTFTAKGTPYAGRLDPLIITDLFKANGIENAPRNRTALRDAYMDCLAAELDHTPVSPLPGAVELVSSLSNRSDVTLGVLTGNFEESGRRKLRSAGFHTDHFRITVWGDDSPHEPPHRNHLPAVAAERYAELFERDLDPATLIVIGDTPGDVECALHHGGRCLAVTTGRFTAEELTSAGAHRVVDSLVETDELTRWILSQAPTAMER